MITANVWIWNLDKIFGDNSSIVCLNINDVFIENVGIWNKLNIFLQLEEFESMWKKLSLYFHIFFVLTVLKLFLQILSHWCNQCKKHISSIFQDKPGYVTDYIFTIKCWIPTLMIRNDYPQSYFSQLVQILNISSIVMNSHQKFFTLPLPRDKIANFCRFLTLPVISASNCLVGLLLNPCFDRIAPKTALDDLGRVYYWE